MKNFIFYHKLLFITLAFLLVLVITYLSFLFSPYRNPDVIFGTSFDYVYARYLGLDPHKVYETILNDWNFRHIRLSAHWDAVEPKEGEYDFAELDWLMKKSSDVGAKVVLAIGQKTPRWPECHIPSWAAEYPKDTLRLALEKYITQVVTRYKDNSALEIWQVENEPFLGFGKCPKITSEDFAEEIALVKKLDTNHQVIATDSGELSSWSKTATASDLFGTTIYRVVWNKYFGYWSYDFIPAVFYKTKLWLAGRSPSTAYVIELQAEPWSPNTDIYKLSLDEQYKSMNPKRIEKNIDFARQVGFGRTYFWGAEWWYWLKERGVTTFSEAISKLNSSAISRSYRIDKKQ